MRKKTESLTFPKDPLAAMRELQDLNPARRTETPSDAPEPGEAEHPLREAIVQILSAPYPATLARGPFTVTSVKIHTELWNRVGMASTLTGLPKQEILAEALRAYLETLRLNYTHTQAPPPGGRDDDQGGSRTRTAQDIE
jgi:hypothetical protein